MPIKTNYMVCQSTKGLMPTHIGEEKELVGLLCLNDVL